MVSVFNSQNSAWFIAAKSLLQKNKIPFIPKGENAAGLEFTAFEILVREQDFDRARNIVSGVEENNKILEEKYNKKHNPFFGYLIIAIILIAVILLFALGIWIRE